MAVGNIFISRRFKFTNVVRDTSKSSSQHNWNSTRRRQTNKSSNKKDNNTTTKPNHKGNFMDNPKNIIYLQSLGLPIVTKPKMKDIKDAYRKIALECHPDRRPPGGTIIDNNSQYKRFQEASVAYKQLLNLIND